MRHQERAGDHLKQFDAEGNIKIRDDESDALAYRAPFRMRAGRSRLSVTCWHFVLAFRRPVTRSRHMGVEGPLHQLGHHQEGRDHSQQKREIGSRQIYELEPLADCRQEGQREG